MRFVTSSVQRTIVAIIVASLLVLGVRPLIFNAGASELHNRFAKISASQAGATARYNIGFDIATADMLGSISLLFCGNSPLQGEACIAPNGFDASSATLLAEAGETGFSIDPSSTTNHIVLTRTAVNANPGPARYTLSDIVNPGDIGGFYLRIQTFATQDATGPSTDFGGVALVIPNDNVSVSTYVPPYLLFCLGVTIDGTDCETVSGNYVNFGELSTRSSRTTTTQMVVATNAGDGYVITVNGTTMLSGTNAIPALVSNDVSRPGTSQFGMNLRSNNDPDVGQNPVGAGTGAVKPSYNVPDRYRFVSGEQVAGATHSDAYRKYTTSYIVNIAKGQAPGIYVSTLSYICTATF